MYNFIRAQKIWFFISLGLVAISLAFIIAWGLRLGIDFTGGSLLQVQFNRDITSEEIQNILEDQEGVQIQTAGDRVFVLRMKPLSNDERKSLLKKLDAEEQSFESIGPTIGKELRRKAVISIILVLAVIIFYIAYTFRKVSAGPVPAWFYGVSAVLALMHDLVITIGVFSVLGKFLGIEVDSLFVTALLTVLGFSVHDTIVVYDRIRENLRLASSHDSFEHIVNRAINQTLTRSLNTSLTTLFVLTALFIFGGASIRYFVLALIVGITAGTYSSIFIASPLLLFYRKFRKK